MLGIITAITLTATADRKRINTLSGEMYTTNMIRETVTGMLDAKKSTDDVWVNMTRYASSNTRPEEVRIIALLDKTETDVSRSLEYIALDEFDMLWYVKRKDQTPTGITKKVALGKDAEMVITNVTNSTNMSGNYKKIENRRSGEIELDLVFKIGKKLEEKYYVKGN